MKIKLNFYFVLSIILIFSISLHASDFSKYLQKAYNAGSLDDSIKYYTLAIESWTESDGIKEKAIAYKLRGVAYDEKGLYDKAIEDYNKAIELAPNHVNAYNNRGRLYYFKGLYDKSLNDFKKSIELNPQDTYAYLWNIIVSSKISENKYEKSLNELKNYLLSAKDEWIKTVAKYYCGYISKEKVLEEAEKGRDEKERNERFCEAYYYIGEMELIKGRKTAAKEYFEKCLKTGVIGFCEYAAAKFELSKMR